MNFLTVSYETKESILKSFDAIADKISKDIVFKINNARYQITDFEFYCFAEKLQDPYTHLHKLQQQKCKLYLHGSGIDLTFGEDKKFGGILLRSVIRLQDDKFDMKQFNGPHVVATELFSNLNSLDSCEKNEVRLIDIEGRNQDSLFYPAEFIVKTKRVGLTSKINDINNYYKNIKLRYIAILPKLQKFKQVIKGIEGILGEKVIAGEISADEARKILGYNRNF